jgi:very-short-patch-repair endonuclease
MDRAARDRRARELRREMSRTEWWLWYRLQRRQLSGCKFRRQVPIGPYFADFACLEAKLVVEVDGDHHGDQLAYDARRDRWLGEKGFRVLRFWVASRRMAPHLPPQTRGEDASVYYCSAGGW